MVRSLPVRGIVYEGVMWECPGGTLVVCQHDWRNWMQSIGSILWITLHSVAYLVLAGVVLSITESMWWTLSWFVFGWVILVPTMFAPSWIAQRVAVARSDT